MTEADRPAPTGREPASELSMARPTASYFDAVGGSETFRRLVRGFYVRVADDTVLRPLYPEEDLGPAEERLRMFLEQYWGGPTTYSDQRGHPALRRRHLPFAIGAPERDAWLVAMRGALDDLALTEEQELTLWEYLVSAAFAMQNRA